MSNKNKNKDQYINSGDAPIVYDDETQNVDQTPEQVTTPVEEKKEDPTQIEEPKVESKPAPAPVESKVEKIEAAVEVVKKPKNYLPENINNNLMKVRIIGNRSMNGVHMMYPFAIANAVIESNGRYSIIVSKKTAPLIVEIIRNHSEKFGKTLDSAKKESIIARFLADEKRMQL